MNKGQDIDRPSRKLGNQQDGPFQIIQRVGYTFKLDLLKGIRVHLIFSRKKLRLTTTTEPLLGQLKDEGPKLEINDHSEWEIDKLLASQIIQTKLHYHISQLGPDPNPKWYPMSYLKNVPMALQAFHNANPQATGPPVRLKKWIKAAEEDHFIEDYEYPGC